jgi:hypothetical protein
MFIEVAVDGGLQIDDGAEDPSSQALAGQSGEEIFDGVEPGAGGRGEMEGPARMADEPGLDLGVLVGCVIVDNGVDQLASRDRAFDGVEEADELLMGMLLHAATEHHAVEHVEGGEQGGRAVALVIVCHGPALAGFERQARLGSVESLDLRLLVDGQHDGMGRRAHIEADDVLDLLGESGVLGALEGSQSVRLQPVRLPDALEGLSGISCGGWA